MSKKGRRHERRLAARRARREEEVALQEEEELFKHIAGPPVVKAHRGRIITKGQT